MNWNHIRAGLFPKSPQPDAGRPSDYHAFKFHQPLYHSFHPPLYRTCFASTGAKRSVSVCISPCLYHNAHLFSTSSSKYSTDVGSDVIPSLARRFEVESDAEISRISSDVREAKGPLGIHQNSLSVKKGGRILTKSAYTEKRGGKQRSIAGTWSNPI